VTIQPIPVAKLKGAKALIAFTYLLEARSCNDSGKNFWLDITLGLGGLWAQKTDC
jgi:hypothetical protein